MWDATASVLARDGYRVIALDQRGSGESDRAPSYSLDLFVEDLAAFIAGLGIEPFALVGLSVGGRVAYRYASRPDARVRRLVIVDTGPVYERSGVARVLARRTGPEVFKDPAEAVHRQAAAQPRWAARDAAGLVELVRYNLLETPEGGWTWRYDPKVHAEHLVRAAEADGWAALARVRCPTLVVRGQQSDLLGHETAERMARELPSGVLVEVPGAGHLIPLEEPDAFVAVLRRFLTS